jgi:hypothetical protein
MTSTVKTLPKWILIVSGLFAIMELMVSACLYISPQSMIETLDYTAKDTCFLIYMWAARQLALGFIFAFATFKKSVPMLVITYLFFLMMFVGDFVAGVLQNQNSLIISALTMCLVSIAVLFAINKHT